MAMLLRLQCSDFLDMFYCGFKQMRHCWIINWGRVLFTAKGTSYVLQPRHEACRAKRKQNEAVCNISYFTIISLRQILKTVREYVQTMTYYHSVLVRFHLKNKTCHRCGQNKMCHKSGIKLSNVPTIPPYLHVNLLWRWWFPLLFLPSHSCPIIGFWY